MKTAGLLVLIAAACLATGTAGAGEWLDRFDDGVVDLDNYQAWSTSGDLTVSEEGGFLSVDLANNSTWGAYYLNAMEIQPGDTVQTVFRFATDYSSASGWSGVGLVWDLDVRPLDNAVAYVASKIGRNWLRAFTGVASEDFGIGHHFGELLTVEIVLGELQAGDTFDATFTIYDETQTELGSITRTTSTPTGRIYWAAGDAWTLTEVHGLAINVPLEGTDTPGDANRNGLVDDDDLSLLLASWGQDVGWANGNFNGDNIVDDDDLSLLLANWTGSGAVPEPGTMGLASVGGLATLRRWRRSLTC